MPNQLTREDLELETDPPRSIKDIVVEEYLGFSQTHTDRNGVRNTYPKIEESLDNLLQRVYAHIERKTLELYHSNEPWALRQWALSNILKDEVVNEAACQIATELITPVIEWQNESFDPISHYRQRLDIERKSDRTKECYLLTAARFVAKAGRKRHYSDDDIIDYLSWVNSRLSQNSYCQECGRLLQFLRRLPGADRNRQLPINMPKAPDEFYQPTFSEEDVEGLIWATVIDDIPFNIVIRLLVASVYGARRSELGPLSSEDININGAKSTIYIRTKKGGQKKRQPIPESIVPLFAVPVTPMHGHTLQRQLKRICKIAGVNLPFRGGYHCFRRRVVTAICEVEPSDSNVSNFMRWAKPRSMLARYKQTPTELTDKVILEKHPFVKMWEEVTPHLLRLNSSYSNQAPLNDNT